MAPLNYMKEFIMNTILVTGASGNLGKEVVKALVAKNFIVKAATRKPEKMKAPEAVIPILFSYEDIATHESALKGSEGVFLIAPPLDPEAHIKIKPFMENAKKSGINHIVLTSVLGADHNEGSPLRMIEHLLIASGINYTFLRPNFFMENFSTGFVSPMIKQGGISIAAGDGKTSFISTVDIAESAAVAFSDKLYGKEYNLTGPESLDHGQVAEIIGNALGKKIAYNPIPEEMMLQGIRGMGMPETAVQYMANLYYAVREGYTAMVSNDVEKVTKHKAVSFAEFAGKNVNNWK